MMKNGAKPGRTLLRKRNRKEKEDFDSEDATIILPSSRGAPETKHPTGRKKHGALLFFVFLSVFSILTFRLPRRTSSIPKLIWFTSKASTIEKLPDNHTLCVDSWRRLNPEYQIRYHNDSEAEFFMCSSLPSEYCEAYRQLPLPVMKADMWRYAILYVHGGVYADINAENRIPIREWAAAENCGFWAGQENSE